MLLRDDLLKIVSPFGSLYNPTIYWPKKEDTSLLQQRNSYQWHKHQYQNDCSADEEASTEQTSKGIDDVSQRVCPNDGHRQHNAGHIDGGSYELGIIQTFDLDLAGGKGHDECSNLNHHLVAIEHTQEDITSSGITDVDAVLNYNVLLLKINLEV